VNLRTRLTLAASAAVAVAVLLAAGYCYVSVRDSLRNQVDERLADQVARVRDPDFFSRILTPVPDSPLADEQPVVQLIGADGAVSRPANQRGRIPVDDADRAVAAGGSDRRLRDATVLGQHVRVITVPAGPGVAVQLTRSLSETERNLSDLRLRLILAGVGGVALAAALGLLVARAALRPVRRLTDAAEHVAQTQDLSASIDVAGRDEIGRLATSFNEMLDALDHSRVQQRQLVEDASHELRTPITSLRTNIEVLAQQDAMAADDRARLLSDAVAQLEELTVLVGDLVELAREEHTVRIDQRGDVRLDDVVERAVDRARLHAPGLLIRIRANAPAIVHGDRALLERAVANILDNACKWSPPEGEIDVALVGGELSVRDHGPGIDGLDLPHVFDRFYRAPTARAMPGSGLGLAIVQNVATAHGGTVSAAAAPGGGAVVRLRLPIEAADHDLVETEDLTPEDDIDDAHLDAHVDAHVDAAIRLLPRAVAPPWSERTGVR
jgi:two-component system sensor histidine kinase MprB